MLHILSKKVPPCQHDLKSVKRSTVNWKLAFGPSVSQTALWSLDRSAKFSPGIDLFPFSVHVRAEDSTLVTVQLGYIMLNPVKATLEPITSTFREGRRDVHVLQPISPCQSSHGCVKRRHLF